ncbi:MAG TPA: hypothetical protein H9856_05130 [Candidatus Limosilactobacillus merdigallinarum]|uniref:Uncharacterized protein n=1 Tax=Candidatus Limosilactobacillus merdigallinarum TaxID=2838652 RepID=A0A9D1VIX9_9LACO|nr:hypothetical protein [Candidatus Limosilactobacillus merdigallinarum]
MISRKSLRKQAQPDASATKPRRHWVSTVVGILAMLIMMFCLLLNTTVLNEEFVANEITQSTVSGEIQSQINSSLSQYGVAGETITKKQTNELLKTAVKQVYSGHPIKLDLYDILNNLEDDTNDTLSNYGVSDELKNSVTDSVNTEVTNIINSKINTPAVTQFESRIKLAKTLVIVGLIASVAILFMVALYDLFTHTLLRDFRWIMIISGSLFAVFLNWLKPLITSAISTDVTINSLATPIVNDILKQVNWLTIGVVAIGLILFTMSLLIRRRMA